MNQCHLRPFPRAHSDEVVQSLWLFFFPVSSHWAHAPPEYCCLREPQKKGVPSQKDPAAKSAVYLLMWAPFLMMKARWVLRLGTGILLGREAGPSCYLENNISQPWVVPWAPLTFKVWLPLSLPQASTLMFVIHILKYMHLGVVACDSHKCHSTKGDKCCFLRL